MEIVSNKTIDNQLNRLYESYGKLCATNGLNAMILQRIVKRQIDKFEKIKNKRDQQCHVENIEK